MKRWTFRIVLCLLLYVPGAVTTVVVAWGLALWASEPVGEVHLLAPYRGMEQFHVCGRSLGLRIDLIQFYRGRDAGIGVDQLLAAKRPIEGGSGVRSQNLRRYAETMYMWEWTARRISDPTLLFDSDDWIAGSFLRCGFPAFAMGHEIRYRHRMHGSWAQIISGHQLPNGLILPLRPIFSGFLIDTLFYAVIWFGLFFGIGTVWRRIRRGYLRGRGRCVKCGYDLRGTPDDVEGCSECGWGREDGTTSDELRTTSEE